MFVAGFLIGVVTGLVWVVVFKAVDMWTEDKETFAEIAKNRIEKEASQGKFEF